jgi:hypothetical protein
MAALEAAIHADASEISSMDGRVKPGHDEQEGMG